MKRNAIAGRGIVTRTYADIQVFGLQYQHAF
jgi:hypothetical protein